MDIRPVPLKEVWMLRHAVMYPGYPEAVVKLKDDELGTHLGIYKDGELASVVSVFQQGREMQFRKLATRQDWQGKGLASALLHYIDHLAQQKKVHRLWCNARLSATGLYEKMGMYTTGRPWQALGQDFIVMEKKTESRENGNYTGNRYYRRKMRTFKQRRLYAKNSIQ